MQYNTIQYIHIHTHTYTYAHKHNRERRHGKGWFFVRSANVRNLVTDPALEASIKESANRNFQIAANYDSPEIEAQGRSLRLYNLDQAVSIGQEQSPWVRSCKAVQRRPLAAPAPSLLHNVGMAAR